MTNLKHFSFFRSALNLPFCNFVVFYAGPGWTEHLQRVLHSAHQFFQTHQLEREVQQRQESGLHAA